MMTTKTLTSLLVVDDDEAVRLYLRNLLGRNFEVLLASGEREALEVLAKRSVDIVLLDLILADEADGLPLLKKIREKNDDTEVVVVSGIRSVKTIVETMQAGAVDYLNKPIEKEELFLTLNRVIAKRALRKQNQALKEQLVDNTESENVIGVSKPIAEIKTMIQKLKGQEVNVFLVGDTGTGKEVFARLLHRQEGEPTRPFISVNCAAIPQDLLESVLFGHEKGSFTGATETRIGKFELANGGDIFLDEISCLTLDLQAKLLRVLEEKEVERVGGKAAKKVNFRVISACNENILGKVSKGEFRSDLFYRLNTVTIQLPSLNERKEDIIPLAEYFLKKYKRSTETKTLSSEVKETLENHDWRGNVRELRNTIENMLIFAKGNVLMSEDVPFSKMIAQPVLNSSSAIQAGHPILQTDSSMKFEGNYDDILQNVEREIITKALEKNRWSKTKTCKSIGISRNKLYRKLDELGIA